MARKLIDTNSPPEIVTIVLPEGGKNGGAFEYLTCSGAVTHAYLQRYQDEETGAEKYAVSPAYAQKGVVLLRELYLKERNADGWRDYEAWMRANWGKEDAKPFPDDKLPLEVRRRRGLPEKKRVVNDAGKSADG